MNHNAQQVNEDYKFRMAYVISIIRDMFATSKVIEKTELENKIRLVEENEDSEYIERLKKDINTHETENIKKRTTKRSQTTNNIGEVAINENVIEGSNTELSKDEDDLSR